MRWYLIAIFLFLIFSIIIGFIPPLFIESLSLSCTQKACSPPQSEENFTGEIECNSCRVVDFSFISGIFNVYEHCSKTEILVYSEGERIDTTYSDLSNCEYRVAFFDLGLLEYLD